jgi:hypothetical protein
LIMYRCVLSPCRKPFVFPHKRRMGLEKLCPNHRNAGRCLSCPCYYCLFHCFRS